MQKNLSRVAIVALSRAEICHNFAVGASCLQAIGFVVDVFAFCTLESNPKFSSEILACTAEIASTRTSIFRLCATHVFQFASLSGSHSDPLAVPIRFAFHQKCRIVWASIFHWCKGGSCCRRSGDGTTQRITDSRASFVSFYVLSKLATPVGSKFGYPSAVVLFDIVHSVSLVVDTVDGWRGRGENTGFHGWFSRWHDGWRLRWKQAWRR